MYTVIETRIFQHDAAKVWRDSERIEFISWIANNPLVGDVIPGSGGLRKVRWVRPGTGKRCGVRVIYYNKLDSGVIWLLTMYSKSRFSDLPTTLLSELREAIENA